MYIRILIDSSRSVTTTAVVHRSEILKSLLMKYSIWKSHKFSPADIADTGRRRHE